MNIIETGNGTRFLSFEEFETDMKQYIAFLETGPNIGITAQRLGMLKSEAVNTLAAAMYSGRSMLDGTAGEIKATPDDEIAYSAETCGCFVKNRIAAEEALLSKKTECVARYLSTFLAHFAGKAVAL